MLDTQQSATLPDVRRLRGVLAEANVTHREFARRCGLSREYVSRILHGYPAGELAAIKLAHGIKRLGLDWHTASSAWG